MKAAAGMLGLMSPQQAADLRPSLDLRSACLLSHHGLVSQRTMVARDAIRLSLSGLRPPDAIMSHCRHALQRLMAEDELTRRPHMSKQSAVDDDVPV